MNSVGVDRSGPAFREGVVVDELVVPIAGKHRYDRAAAVATRLAERWNTTIRLIHVLTGDGDEIDADRLAKVRRELSAQYPATTFASSLLEGDDPVAAIVDALDDACLVVVATDHASQWGDEDSVGERIALAAKTPVLLCGPKVDSEHVFGPVVVGLDGSPTAEAGLEPAVSLARSLDTRLWLVRAVDSLTVEHIRRLKASGSSASESGYLLDVAERLGDRGIDVGWEIVHDDDAVSAILGFAANQEAGPIVAGTHGDEGLSRRMFGSTAMGLVESSRYPVLVVNAGGRDEPQLEP